VNGSTLSGGNFQTLRVRYESVCVSSDPTLTAAGAVQATTSHGEVVSHIPFRHWNGLPMTIQGSRAIRHRVVVHACSLQQELRG
jgi:hypothetical protein